MNAHATAAPAAPAPSLTQAIIQNADVLRRIEAGEAWKTKAEMAEAFGRNAGNFSRAMLALAEDGVIDGWDSFEIALTERGRKILQGLDVIDGRVALPPNVSMVRARLLVPNPANPRQDWTSDKAVREDAELAASIARTLGPRLPIEAYPPDADGLRMIESGERRWRATIANIEAGEFPETFEVLVITKPRPSEQDMLDAMVEENIQHRQLTYTEEARYFERSIANGRTHDDVAGRCHRSVKHVQDYLRLLKHPDVLEQLEQDVITLQAARKLIAERNKPSLFGQGDLPRSEAKAAKAAPPSGEPEADPAAGDQDQPDDAAPALRLPAKLALLIAEVADRAARAPAPHMEQGWTRVVDVPISGAAPDLVRMGLLAFRNHGGFNGASGPGPFARVMLQGNGGEAWLRANGFYDGPRDRQDLLTRLREAVLGQPKAIHLGVHDLYATDWLNLPSEEEEDREEAEADAAETASSGRVVLPGLTGDGFSDMLRRSTEPEEATEPEPPSPPTAGEASEPGSRETVLKNVTARDLKAVATVAREVSERLALWRAGPEMMRSHSQSWDDNARDLADAMIQGRVIDAIAMLAPYLSTHEGMAATFLARALGMVIELTEEG